VERVLGDTSLVIQGNMRLETEDEYMIIVRDIERLMTSGNMEESEWC
jgi:hypothetical protein